MGQAESVALTAEKLEDTARSMLSGDLAWTDELRAVARRAMARVRGHGAGSLLVQVDLRGVPHNLVIAAIMQEGVAESRPHVHARAVVGLDPAAARSFEVATTLFGGPMARFDEPVAATEWLLAQAVG